VSTPDSEDPARLALRARPRPVTRLNRRTLAVLALGVIALVTVGCFWAFRAPSLRVASNAETQAADRVPRAEGFNALPRDYGSMPKPPVLGPPLGELGRSTLSAERSGPSTSGFQPNAEEEAARAVRLREEAEARKAQVFYSLRQRALPAATTAGINAAPQIAGEPTTERRDEGDVNGQRHKERFASASSDGLIYASGTLEQPRSPYELMAGTVIPAALWTEVNSDLPGEVIATVTENVYDSVRGRYLLIPQGSRLIGQYDSQVAFGQRRVLMVWTRLIRADGSSIVLDRLPATDAAGSAGIEDQVNYHWARLFEAAAISTLLGTSAELAVPQGRSGTTILLATRESAQDTVNQVGQELTRRNLDIQPTLKLRRGFPVQALIRKDLILPPVPNTQGVMP
jgi:type IV secretion system protein TrbI